MPDVQQITAGIDWLTLTIGKDKPNSSVWKRRAILLIRGIANQGYELKERAMLGYEGMSAGNCFIGEREDDYMAQFTGFHADGAFPVMYRPDAHISRIDLQVTIRFDVMPKDVAKSAYKDAINANLLLPASRRRKIFIIVGSDGGDTCYIGSPSSDTRARVYNKEVQSEDPNYERTWRYEVVNRNDNATSAAHYIWDHLDDSSGVCADYVCAWLEMRGITCPWLKSPDMKPIPLIRSLPTDVERKLRWLSEQVAPTIRYLCDLGFRDTILAELGLSGRAGSDGT